MADSVGNKDLYDAINDFRQEAQKTYVTIDRFNPVAKVVYGTAGMVGVAFLTALIAAVFWVIPNAQKNPTSVAKAPAQSVTSNPPSATASATSHSDTATPSATQVSSSGGLVSETLKGTGL